MKKSGFIWILGIASLLSSCMQDDGFWNNTSPLEPMRGEGLFIINEGNFMYGNASLSYYDPENRKVYNEVFLQANSLPLGDVAYSMTIRDSLAYMVVNNSGRVYVMDTNDFSYKGKITGLTSPRYIHFVNNRKAYVTDLYARAISIVDPQALEVTGTIDVSNTASQFYQHATEQMIQLGKYVYVNCWSFDRQILIIDSELDRVVDSVEVLKQPNSMVLDRNQDLWVLCDGGFQGSPFGYEQPGLVKIPAGSDRALVVERFPYGQVPRDLCMNRNRDTLYYICHHVYRRSIFQESEPELFIPSPYDAGFDGGFYCHSVDPDRSEVYLSDAIDFVQRGWVYRFDPGGIPLDTFQVGIAPGAFCFNPFRKTK